MSFAENLKRLRRFRGYTQKELGTAADISPNSIINYENKKRTDPPASIVEKLANALRIPSDVLFVSRIYERDGVLIAEKLNDDGEITSATLIHPNGMTREEMECYDAEYFTDSAIEDALQHIRGHLQMLNDNGIKEAVNRIAELTEISKYTE